MDLHLNEISGQQQNGAAGSNGGTGQTGGGGYQTTESERLDSTCWCWFLWILFCRRIWWWRFKWKWWLQVLEMLGQHTLILYFGGNAATDHSAATTGGVGNPAGSQNDTTSGSGNGSESGNGGLIILIVGGNLTIGSNGSIVANGRNSGACSGGNSWHGSGGASGGGNIVIAHRGSYTNNGSVTANGGTSGTVTSYQYSRRGGNGGNGSVQTLQVL